MGVTTEQIDIKVSESGAVSVKRRLEDIGKSSRVVASGVSILTAALGGLAAAFTFDNILRIIDSYDLLQNQLKRVTKSSDDLAKVNAQLNGIARETYTALEPTVGLYVKVSESFKAIGRNAKDAVSFTELFLKTATLSGKGVEATTRAIDSFAKALNKGKIDGGALRDVLQEMPYLSQVLQQQFGVTEEKLYKMADAGKISFSEIVRGVMGAKRVIEGDFAGVIPTVSMAMGQLSRAFMVTIGEAGKSTGAMNMLAYAILWVADNMNLVIPILAALGIAIATFVAVSIVGSLMGALIRMVMFITVTAIPALVQFGVALTTALAGTVIAVSRAVTATLIPALTRFATFLTVTLIPTMIRLAVAVAVATWPFLLAAAVGALIGLFVVWAMQTGVVTDALAYLGSVGSAIWSAIVSGASSALAAITSFADYLSSTATSAWETFRSTAQSALETVLGLVTSVWDKIVEIAVYVRTKFVDAWNNAMNRIRAFIQPVIDLVRTLVGWIRDAINAFQTLGRAKAAAGGGGGGAAPGFATGGQFMVGGSGAGRDTTPVRFNANRGERVTVETRKQQRANDNSPAVANVNVPVEVINVLDESVVRRSMESAQGRRIIYNVIADDRDNYRNLLAR